MNSSSKPWTHCAACARPIFCGNAYVSFVRNVEQVDRPAAHRQGVVTVIDSNELISLCAECGNHFVQDRALARCNSPCIPEPTSTTDPFTMPAALTQLKP